MTVDLVLVGGLILVVGLMLVRTGGGSDLDQPEPLPLDETAKGQALIAIKDLEFDHATGKLADDDYRQMRDRFVRDAATLLEADHDPAEAFVAGRKAQLVAGPARCPSCGPRPELGANYCSTCGVSLR